MPSTFHSNVTFGRSEGFAPASAERASEAAPHVSTLRDSYFKIRRATEALCHSLAIEDYVVQSLPEASPAKWHLAHTTWFFEEFVLLPFLAGYHAHDPDYRALFGLDSEATRIARAARGTLSRPTVEQTLGYRQHVDEHMHALLAAREESEELWRIVTLGLHREQQHQELLLTDLKHAFFVNPLKPIYAEYRAAAPRESPPLELVDFEGGLIEVGHAGRGFRFDSELPRHAVCLAPFRLANRLITNGEFRGFIDCGGYGRPEYWLEDGWEWVERERWQRPLFWDASLESEFTLSGIRELDPHAPVSHLSFYEADAFARWAGARLPTEFEWEAAACSLPVHGNFAEEEYWRPLAPEAGSGPLQMFGDAWEWTRSAYAPYPRHVILEGALGELCGRFAANQLTVRGGSCATSRSHVRATYRRGLRPEARWQVTGLRLAMDG